MTVSKKILLFKREKDSINFTNLNLISNTSYVDNQFRDKVDRIESLNL